MFVLSNFIMALARILGIALNLYMWIIIIRAVATWFSPDPYNPIYQFLVRITEPVLGYIRKIIPFSFGMMDISPIIAIFVIIFLQTFLVQSLFGIAMSLK
ncbi:MAG TPA: YggT family protein [Proteobacteria bacterium]|nr:YGGT family protein [bacterium BMS3Abin14]HDL53525.1 YggT family protein [Pseudomonadota bacterium]